MKTETIFILVLALICRVEWRTFGRRNAGVSERIIIRFRRLPRYTRIRGSVETSAFRPFVTT